MSTNQPLQRIPTLPHSPASPLHFLRLRKWWEGEGIWLANYFFQRERGKRKVLLAGDKYSEIKPDPKSCSFSGPLTFSDFTRWFRLIRG